MLLLPVLSVVECNFFFISSVTAVSNLYFIIVLPP